jgi:hypothetical protein
MIKKLPLKIYPDYSYKVSLGGIDMVFNIRWNDAHEFWALTITDISAVRIAGDIMMTTNVNLFYEKRGLGLPTGSLYLIDTKSTGLKPEFDNIVDFALVYSE